MNAKERDELAGVYLSGEITEAQAEMLLQELKAEASFVKELAELEDMDLMIRTVGRTEAERRDLADRIMASLADEPRRQRTILRVMEDVASLPAGEKRRMRWDRWTLSPWAAAAAAFVAALAGAALIAFLQAGPYDKVLAGELHVTRDGQTMLVKSGERLRADDDATAATIVTCSLRDGSLVKLDRGSRAVFGRRGWGERAHLALKEGRMFLRVAKVSGRFVVSGDRGDVEVLGTIFGVAREKDALAVSVFKGRVAVRSPVGALEVGNGQSAQAAAEQKPVLVDVDPNQALSWARDTTEFRARPLGEVLDWIEANSSYTFNMPPTLRSETVTIVISEVSMSNVIEALCVTCGATCEIRGTRVIVGRK